MNQSIKVGIITSVIATLVFMYLLDPILRLVGEAVGGVSRVIFTGLMDSLYRKAALGVAKDPAFVLYGIVAGILSGFVAGIIASLVRKSFFPPNEQSNRSKKPLYIAGFFLAVFPFILLYQLWSIQFQYNVITSFNQHITIVTPYVEQAEISHLKSDFARMTSEADFQAISQQLDSIASENEIELPKNPSYGLFSF